RNGGRGADAAATPHRRDDEGDRGAVVRVDLGVDEGYIPAPKRGDQAEALSNGAAAVFARARGDQAQQVLGPVATAEPTGSLRVVEPGPDRRERGRGERSQRNV